MLEKVYSLWLGSVVSNMQVLTPFVLKVTFYHLIFLALMHFSVCFDFVGFFFSCQVDAGWIGFWSIVGGCVVGIAMAR